ncbi:MAG TPA: hypothetical protein PL061_13435 [Syntrophales bacterium]|nr:hypothetical protein [Syntrophales bacterium]
MKKTIVIFMTIVIFTLVMVSSAFAGDIIGRHNLSNDRGLVKVRSVVGNKMAVDIIYVPQKGKMIMLTDVFADYDPLTHQAVYSEDRFCPDALKLSFQSNGKVVLHQKACAAF